MCTQHTAQEAARSSHADQGKRRTGTFVTTFLIRKLTLQTLKLPTNDVQSLVCSTFSETTSLNAYTLLLYTHLVHTSCTHILYTHLVHTLYTHLVHTPLQLQTTSKENAGAQKNVMSLITRNRITVYFTEITWLVSLTLCNSKCAWKVGSAKRVVGPKPDSPTTCYGHDLCTSLPPHAHTHYTHLHTHTHTCAHMHTHTCTHTHTHTQQKLGIYGKGKSSETVTRRKLYCGSGKTCPCESERGDLSRERE